MIIIKEKANKRMKEYVRQMGDSEIGGLLLGKVVKNGDFIIDEVVLLKQSKTFATFDIDDESMFDFTKTASPKRLKRVIGWWHSHGNMATFWSGVDDDCFHRLTNFLNGKCFGIVWANRPKNRFSARCRIDFLDKDKNYISVDKIQVDLEDRGLFKIKRRDIAREIKQKVREEPSYSWKIGKKKKGIEDIFKEDKYE
jgi:proteasome lid subunit RPN8/RPN11